MPYVYIKTYGCQMNEYDSEVIAGLLCQKDFSPTSDMDRADLIIVNTCYVREKVKHKVFSFLGELKKLKEQKPHLILGVGGCLAQKDPQEILKRAPYVDIIWGTLNLQDIPELVDKVTEGESPIIKVESEGKLPDDLPLVRNKKFSAYIPVIRGCNNFCTYCNVPYVRGREKSRSLKSIIREVEMAAREGFKEVVLLGQNVNSYGKDLPGHLDFADLLYEVSKVEGISRIRFTTSHPKDLSEKLMLAMANIDKVCEHLHLPLQAGSNKILKLMRRGYTREDYLKLVSQLRSLIPDISLTTDLIVGFPGEEEEDFNQTLDMVKKVKFDGAFTFEYSPIPGTIAAKFDNQIPDSVKGKRLRRLIEIQRRITEEKNEVWIGKTVEVLVEGLSRKDPRELQGRTRHNKIVVFSGKKDLIGELINVRVNSAGCWALRGEIVSC